MKKTLPILVLTVVILLVLGGVVLATASTVRAQHYFGSPYGFLRLQLRWLCVAVPVGIVASRFDYHHWKKCWALPLAFYLTVAVLLMLVFCPGIGKKVNGAHRWLGIGPLRLQPSEFAKLAVIVACAVWMDRIGWRTRQFLRGAVVPSALLGGVVLLLLLEPDLGATLVVGTLGGLMMIVAGTRVAHLLAIAAAGTPLLAAGAMLIAGKERILQFAALRAERIATWREGAGSTSDKAHQQLQAVLSFKIGGPGGVGLGQSIQKNYYLPEAHTDFIFAIGGEELGFAFSIMVIILYAAVLVCGMWISMCAPDRLGRLLAFGMTLLLVFQAAFNIGVVTGCLPTKGLALPFFSYGGTNLIVALFAVGTLVNIGMHVGVFDERMHTKVVRDAVDKI